MSQLLGADSAPFVRCAAVVCVGELCVALSAKVLAYLPSFMPHLLAVVQDLDSITGYNYIKLCSSPSVLNASTYFRSDALLSSVLSGLQKLFSSVLQFLSPYIKDLIRSVCVCKTTIMKTF